MSSGSGSGGRSQTEALAAVPVEVVDVLHHHQEELLVLPVNNSRAVADRPPDQVKAPVHKVQPPVVAVVAVTRRRTLRVVPMANLLRLVPSLHSRRRRSTSDLRMQGVVPVELLARRPVLDSSVLVWPLVLVPEARPQTTQEHGSGLDIWTCRTTAERRQ